MSIDRFGDEVEVREGGVFVEGGLEKCCWVDGWRPCDEGGCGVMGVRSNRMAVAKPGGAVRRKWCMRCFCEV